MSDDYINRETFLEDVKEIEKQLADFNLKFTKEDVLRHLETTRRIVKMVRCKNCALRNTIDCAMSAEIDGKYYSWTTDNAFCSYGRRKEDQNEQTTYNGGSR